MAPGGRAVVDSSGAMLTSLLKPARYSGSVRRRSSRGWRRRFASSQPARKADLSPRPTKRFSAIFAHEAWPGTFRLAAQYWTPAPCSPVCESDQRFRSRHSAIPWLKASRRDGSVAEVGCPPGDRSWCGAIVVLEGANATGAVGPIALEVENRK